MCEYFCPWLYVTNIVKFWQIDKRTNVDGHAVFLPPPKKPICECEYQPNHPNNAETKRKINSSFHFFSWRVFITFYTISLSASVSAAVAVDISLWSYFIWIRGMEWVIIHSNKLIITTTATTTKWNTYINEIKQKQANAFNVKHVVQMRNISTAGKEEVPESWYIFLFLIRTHIIKPKKKYFFLKISEMNH